MDGKGAIQKILMLIGFVGAGIGGAVACGELPENIEKAKAMLSKKEENPSEKTE